MQRRIFIRRSEKERVEKANKVSAILLIVILGVIGGVSIQEYLKGFVTCNGTWSCLYLTLGATGLFVIGALACWIVVYWIAYLMCKEKEITPKNEQKKQRIKHRKR